MCVMGKLGERSKTCRRGHDNWYHLPGKPWVRYCRTCNTLNVRKRRGKKVPELEPKKLTREEEIALIARGQYDDASWLRRGWAKYEHPVEGRPLTVMVDTQMQRAPDLMPWEHILLRGTDHAGAEWRERDDS